MAQSPSLVVYMEPPPKSHLGFCQIYSETTVYESGFWVASEILLQGLI